MMNRRDIANKVSKSCKFFSNGWDWFCEWVEDCAGQLAPHQQHQIDKRAGISKQLAAEQEQLYAECGWVKWSSYDLDPECHATTCLRLQPSFVFYAPPDLVNPVNWIVGRQNPRWPNEEESLFLTYARLVMAHDSTVAAANRICQPGKHQSGCFDAGQLYQDLGGKVAAMEGNGDLTAAWNDVQPLLEASANGAGPAPAKTTGKERVRRVQRSEADILREIVDAIRRWNPHPPIKLISAKDVSGKLRRAVHPCKTPELVTGAREAVGLMRDNLTLLKDMARRHWCPSPFNQLLDKIDCAKSWPDDFDLGNACWDWWIDFVFPYVLQTGEVRTLPLMLERWANKEEQAAGTGGKRRKSKIEKTVAIAAHLKAHPTATSREISENTGIHASDVRRLYGPIKKALKEGKRPVRKGWKRDDGQTEAIDETTSCATCNDPLDGPWECSLCAAITRGECKTCHFTNSHPDHADP